MDKQSHDAVLQLRAGTKGLMFVWSNFHIVYPHAASALPFFLLEVK